MNTQMRQNPTEPCSLCCGIIDYITCSSAEGSTETNISQPPWHEKVQMIQYSRRYCLLCETIWHSVILRRLEEVQPDYRGVTSLDVSLKFGSHRKANGVHWASILTELTDIKEKVSIRRVDTIGICLQSQDSLHQYPDWLRSSVEMQKSDRMREQIDLMSSWLQECQETHPDCYLPIKPEFLPLRLLHLAKDNIRLVISRNQPSSELRYATLSHCWGGKPPIVTSQATRAAFEESIPEDTLPRTFRDAVKIARALHIPYIWIDSLCIVQDDVDEWQHEAAKMQHIYSGSCLTIAASEAKDSTEGCFENHRKHSGNNATPSYPSPEDARIVSLRIPRRELQIMVRVQTGTAWSNQRSKPLSSRGWVLQEQLLSNRIIYCMESDLHWQCRHGYKTQSGQVIDNDNLLADQHDFIHSRSKRRERIWCGWVTDYSTRDFTFINDRVPALAGITNHYANISGNSALLGLWEQTFTRDLLWIRTGNVKGISCRSIPSWTWLSCYAPIEIDPFVITLVDDNPKEDHVTLLEGTVVWSGPPMTSKIQSTRLVISGPLQTLRFRVDPRARARVNRPYFQIEGEELDETDPFPWTCGGQFDAEEPSREKYMDYPCLLVRTRKHSDQGRFKEVFLILEHVCDASSQGSKEELPVFRRIGIGCKRGDTKRTFISAKRMTVKLV